MTDDRKRLIRRVETCLGKLDAETASALAAAVLEHERRLDELAAPVEAGEWEEWRDVTDAHDVTVGVQVRRYDEPDRILTFARFDDKEKVIWFDSGTYVHPKFLTAFYQGRRQWQFRRPAKGPVFISRFLDPLSGVKPVDSPPPPAPEEPRTEPLSPLTDGEIDLTIKTYRDSDHRVVKHLAWMIQEMRARHRSAIREHERKVLQRIGRVLFRYSIPVELIKELDSLPMLAEGT